jgi:hypothetical protein
VLAVELDPGLVVLPASASLTLERVRAFIDSRLERLRTLGSKVVGCLIDLGDAAEAGDGRDSRVASCRLRRLRRRPSCAQAVAPVREAVEPPPCRGLGARLYFNTNPADTAEAVRRWL